MTQTLSKRDQLARLLARKSGASIASLQKHLGWQPHTIRAEISRLRKTGLAITCSPSAKGTIYKSQVSEPISCGDQP